MSSDANDYNVKRDVDAFANQGLRTLVFGYKELEESVINVAPGTNECEHATVDQIECDLTLFAVTAVEDKL